MLERARAAGVTTLLAIGTGPGPQKLDAALPFAESHDWIYTTVGIHPHEAKEVTQAHYEKLARLAQHPRVIAWGATGLGGILHCFSGTLEEARKGIAMGFLVSFAGNSTYPKAQNLRGVAREIPLDRLLIETDAPYLAPQAYRGKRNEPAYVAEVARTLAGVRDLAADELAAATAQNFRRFFRLGRAARLENSAAGQVSGP